jgi:S-adenosylmethionine hydrolase
MAIISFLSDFGTSDHYVAAVKARILSINPGLSIIDVSHQIAAHDLAHASYVLQSIFRDFPKGTVHLAAIDTKAEGSRHIAVKLEDHFFVGADNGLFSLLTEGELSFVAELIDAGAGPTAFPARDIYARAAAMLASGKSMNDIGKYTKDYKRLIGRKFRATKKQISGNVIRVDHYGNLITNIKKEAFDVLWKDRPFVVRAGREKLDRINNSPGCTEDGDCFVIFNSAGLLEIGINKGNAAQLLGLTFDSSVEIVFASDDN